ncbi:Putative uncharacterized protein [Moritella viscosa]|mgnify:CR=1 FL=1|uniref:hypothetical protein n=1 Tax=Moritella viscosa TaxID=80854 RepID=UPI0005090ACF|nr:hypothetical protein [Moritella viscosa]CED60562.1 putative uncharacterized protein [Moritella viscosa]SHO12875.1 Putative uncharacterized protein [Moritella viscosa]SHO23179.1 Putative uncharacterized protein [Moritella viscosa]
MKIEDVDFSDEIVTGFSYDSINKHLSVTFQSVCVLGEIIYTPHDLNIDCWSKAESCLYRDSKSSELDAHLGVPSLLLAFEVQDRFCSLTINTVDDRYIELRFYDAEVSLVENIIN